MLSREAQDLLFEQEFVDHHLLPGSKVAPDIEKLRAEGVQFIELDVAFAQRIDPKERERIRNEHTRLLRGQ